VRYFKQAGLSDKLRITIGTEEQNRLLLDMLVGLGLKERVGV
jgi:histidinol-phosphate aminotransferase